MKDVANEPAVVSLLESVDKVVIRSKCTTCEYNILKTLTSATKSQEAKFKLYTEAKEGFMLSAKVDPDEWLLKCLLKEGDKLDPKLLKKDKKGEKGKEKKSKDKDKQDTKKK